MKATVNDKSYEVHLTNKQWIVLISMENAWSENNTPRLDETLPMNFSDVHAIEYNGHFDRKFYFNLLERSVNQLPEILKHIEESLNET